MDTTPNSSHRGSEVDGGDDLLPRLEALLWRLQAIDIRQVEGMGAAEIAAKVLGPVREGVAAALELLAEARRVHLTATDTGPGVSGDDSGAMALRLDATMAIDDARERLVDVVVLGQVELASKRSALAAVEPGRDAWDLIDRCVSGRWRALKVVAALIQAIYAHRGLPNAVAWYQTELQISLEIRRVYTRFRRSVALLPEPAPDEVGRRLREAGILLAKLIGRDIYDFARIGDRRQLRAVQARILDWLRARDASPRAGARIWQDFAALAGVLIQVNHRAELREHDLAVARALWPTLAEDEAEAPIGAPALAELRRLYGRSDELDRLVEADPGGPRRAFREALRRILEALEQNPARAADVAGIDEETL